MELLIIGAGAMGGLFGALLVPHAAVSLLTTNQEHAAVINGHGLTLVDLDGATRQVPVRVLTDPQDYGRRADLILVSTKTRATAAVAGTARDLLAADGLVLTLQNGLGNLEQLAAAVGAQRAAAGVTSQAATLLAPGRVRHAGSGPTVLGRPVGRGGAVEAVAALFNRAGLETRISDDVDSLLWSKLIVNVGINALTALLRVPNGVLAQTPACDLLMTRAVDEAVAVARALHIDLDYERQLERVREVCVRTADNRASMLQDILRGRPTEIDAINGAVVVRGRQTGVATPVNLLLTQLVQALEATAADRL
ncbi:MAG: 2-dehydropantoate 2-reductase [Desulfobulbus sp.]|jgi:2-dehydropantoate 2-reductase|nr:2-dehydropantoate 2-reductase [Desulfobulbus sp.]